MKASFLFLAGACGLALTAPVQAQTRPGFEIGAEILDYKYRERFEGETIVKDDGTFIGLRASYVETLANGWFLRAASTTTFGKVDYSSDDGRIENVPQTLGQLEFHAGRDFLIGGKTTLTPFTGIGGRALRDNSGGKETELGLQGYDREIGYAYVPLGLAASVPLRHMKLDFSVQYNWIVNGTAESKLSGLDPDAPDIELDLEEGHGVEASAMLTIPVGRNAVRFGPFLRRWSVDRSKSEFFEDEEFEIEIFEPANKTTEVGVRVAFAF